MDHAGVSPAPGATFARARRVIDAANRPVDGASLAVFRIAFGIAMAVATARFFTHGWIAADYIAPKVFFHYWGFEWVRPWPGAGMYVHYGVLGAAALCVAAGVFYRAACVVFAVTFTYAHLCDKSNYLNHYYLVSIVAFLLVVVPLDREWSVRTLLCSRERRPEVRAWMLWLLRFQIGIVYVFGGIAKLGSDWLVHGEPLRIWLAANAELPVLGPLFDRRWFAIAMSWCGMLFDLSIVPLLSWRRTRRMAYVVVLAFHTLTGLLFRIGMFPWIMSASATLFFDPSWPRDLLARLRGGRREASAPATSSPAGAALGPAMLVALLVHALVQIVVPLRHLAYPGNTLWTEEGFRFAWRVMLIEKSGELELTVVDGDDKRTLVHPREYLTPFQVRMASTQPDMILELAHVVARDFERRTGGPVRVYADAEVSFNGRARAPMIDPNVDLAAEEDGLAPQRFVLPAPTSAPEF